MTPQCLLLLLPLCTLVAADPNKWDSPDQQVVLSVSEGSSYPSYKFTENSAGNQGGYHVITSENAQDGEFSYLQAYSYSYPEGRKWFTRKARWWYYGGFNRRMTVCRGGRRDYYYTVTADRCQSNEDDVFEFYVSTTNYGEFLPSGLSYKHYTYAICQTGSHTYSRITTDRVHPCFRRHKTIEKGEFYAFSGVKLCPERPPPDNAYLNSVDSDGVFRRSITYRCSHGYTMKGPATITCSRGHWSESPSCRRMTCRDPPVPHHAKPVDRTYGVGETLVFECDDGYQLNPRDATIQCMDSGSWTNRLITCELVDCGYPHNFDKGDAVVRNPRKGTTFGAMIDFQCDSGYRLNGAASAECLASGEWSERVPTCGRIECDLIIQPEDGSVTVNGYGVDSAAIFRCHSGYRRVGAETLRCVQRGQTGQWTPSRMPYCEKLSCTKLDDPENGDASVMGYDHGDTAKYSCDPGYNLQGTETRTCQNGQWDGEQPTCQVVICRDPGMLKNGERTGETFQYGSMLTYACDSGYTMMGSKAQVCSETGQWEPREKPRCEIVKCAPLGNPESGSVDASGFEFNSAVLFKCNPGYEMEGESEASCQDNGQWDISSPTCEACPIGYYKEGSNAESCQACPERSTTVTKASHQRELCNCEQGSSGPAGGPCVSVSCEELSAPENGEMDECGTDSGAECTFSCDPGFILLGQRSRRCTEQGWTGIQPVCERCPKNMYKAGPRVTSCMPCPVNTVTGDRLGKSLEDCQCDVGYSSDEDGRCVDVNECENNNGGCEQRCENTPGSFQCSCSIPGYELHSNGINCTLEHSCTNLEQPVEHGHLRCVESRSENGIICHIECDPGFFFVSGRNDYTTCGVETGWVWSHRRVNATARIPACTEEYYVDMGISYTVSYTFREPCEVQSVDYVEFITKYQKILNSVEACQGKCFIRDVSSTCTTINDTSVHHVSFKLFLENPNRNAVDPTCDRNCQRMNLMKIARTSSVVSRAFHDLVNSTGDSQSNLALGTDSMPIPMKPQSLRRIKADLLCPPGKALSKYRLCIPCDKGTYIPKAEMEICLPCPVGSFQTLQGQTKCELCTPSTSTLDVGSDHPAQCNQRVIEESPEGSEE